MKIAESFMVFRLGSVMKYYVYHNLFENFDLLWKLTSQLQSISTNKDYLWGKPTIFLLSLII